MNQPRIAIGFALLSLAVACQTGCRPPGLSLQLDSILTQQAAEWNRGSIEGFMRYYVHSGELTFSSGGELRRGWDATTARYKARYPDRAAMGSLSFTELETTRLGRNHALTLGRWRLDREAGNIGGAFSLIWRRTGNRWLILHDHTTQAPG